MGKLASYNIDGFLARNELLLAEFAHRILKGLPYDRDDIRMEAAVAYYEALDYMNPFKKTKFSSNFTWFYKKRLYSRRRTDLTSTLPKDRKYYPPAAGKDFEETAIEKASGHAPSSRFGSGPASVHSLIPGAADFILCLESFHGTVSLRLYRALIILLGSAAFKAKKKALCSLLGCRSSADIEAMIARQIRREVKEADMDVYLASCVNGALRKVVVCAGSEEEARSYLSKYGDPVEIKTLWKGNAR